MTVKFIGETQDAGEVVRATELVASSCRTGLLTLASIGAFPSFKRAKVLWLGISDDDQAVANLAASPDYRPHLTLARLKDTSLRDHVARHEPYEIDPRPFVVKELVLFQSHLSKKGSTYEVLERFPLLDS